MYLVQAFVIGLDSHAAQDGFDVLGGGAGVSTEHSQEVSGHVTHSASREEKQGIGE